MKKIISVILTFVICLAAICGCSVRGEKETLFGTVAIIGPGGEIILDSELFVNKDNATAADAIKTACAEVKLSYTYVDGMFDNFNGIASAADEGWLFYSEGELADVGAGELSLRNYFEIEFKYENYAEAFSLTE